ncbi:MAG: amino acid ABC transporter permease [Bacillota bacterium]
MAGYDWSLIPRYFIYFLPAAWMTLKLTTAAIAGGIVLGLITALMRLSPIWILRAPASFYVWVIRGTPLLVQILILYVGMVSLVRLEGFAAAAIAFSVHTGAYVGEIFRGAILGVDTGQMEAARSLGMTYPKAMRLIILPQAFRLAVPPLANQFIITLKDSSLASVIAIRELILQARQMGSSQYRMMEFLLIATIYYLIMTTVLTVLATWMENRLRRSDQNAGSGKPVVPQEVEAGD